MSYTASQRALMYLFGVSRDGVGCADVGGAVWPDRAGRICATGGGGDYAAQMLLGRLRKAGFVEHAPSDGSSRWRLPPAGFREVHRINSL